MTDVLRRKIDHFRPVGADGAPGADRAWRLALARAMREAVALDLDFRDLSITRASLAEVLEAVPDHVLVSLLDGPKAGLGVMLLSPGVTSALIEVQTMGRLAPQAPTPRHPTRIDAMMVAGVIDRALAGLEDCLIDEDDLIWAGGFRYASFLDDVRPLPLLLEEDSYRVMTAQVTLGSAGRDGSIILVLPAMGRGQVPHPPPATAGDPVPSFSAGLAAQVHLSECRLDGVVARLRMTLGQVMGLAAGEVLHLPMAGLDQVAVETAAGVPLARARLGQHRGMRALKLLDLTGSQKTPVTALAQQADAPQPELQATG